MADLTTTLTTSLTEVKESLPIGFNISKQVEMTMMNLQTNKMLIDYAKNYPNVAFTNIINGVKKASYLGLDIGTQAHLIPYKEELQFIIDYKGNISLAMKYSTRKIKNIYAKCVKEGDKFEEKIVNAKQTFDFFPLPFNDGPMVGAFAVVEFEDGEVLVEVMSKKDIDDCKNASKSANSNYSPWKKFYGEMAKKTVLHRVLKTIDLDFTARQRELWTEDVAIETNPEKIMENEVVVNANVVEFEEQ